MASVQIKLIQINRNDPNLKAYQNAYKKGLEGMPKEARKKIEESSDIDIPEIREVLEAEKNKNWFQKKFQPTKTFKI